MVLASAEETEILASVSEDVTFESGMSQEEAVVPIVKPATQTLEEGVGPMAKDSLPGENLVSEVEMDVPFASPEVTAPLLR